MKRTQCDEKAFVFRVEEAVQESVQRWETSDDGKDFRRIDNLQCEILEPIRIKIEKDSASQYLLLQDDTIERDDATDDNVVDDHAELKQLLSAERG